MSIIKRTFEDHYEGLVRFANRYLNDMAQAEDVVQEAFIACWKEKDELKTEEQTRAFLYTAIKNRALNVIKHEKVKSNYQQTVISESNNEDLLFETGVITEEVSTLFQKALAELPDQQKSVLTFAMNGYKNSEIGEELGISVNTVKFHKTNAYEAIRKWAKYFFVIFILLFIRGLR
ncbi:RNA polymerase sigma-70 factor [Prolixibacteraceae bacterium JC049]|nr:RNA polymerase sigma-70 factor [Prolixibacteraceae bacterium JC049]